MLFLYNLILGIYYASIRVAGLFDPKAKKWVEGRKQWATRLATQIQDTKKIIWVHCASLGEYEQGLPIIESIKRDHPNFQILLTFYSPSGYELRKDNAPADFVFYLPADTAANAQQFIEIVQPQLAIFIKYEFWYHYLHTLKVHKVPTLLVSAIFRKNQIFFKPYGIFFRKLLTNFDHLFVQNKASTYLLEQVGIKQYTIAGDTRVDRVAQLATSTKSYPIIQAFSQDTNILIAGSTWPADEALLMAVIPELIDQNWKVIIAPHEIKPAKIQQLKKELGPTAAAYSEFQSVDLTAINTLIIDNIGMLSSLYQFGKIAYIGGGFGSGIHNILEPIVFGLPVIFGERYQKFDEAVTLVKNQGAFVIHNKETLQKRIDQLLEDKFYQQAAQQARSYIDLNKGATNKVMEYIRSILQE